MKAARRKANLTRPATLLAMRTRLSRFFATSLGVVLLANLLFACSNPYEARRRLRYAGRSTAGSASATVRAPSRGDAFVPPASPGLPPPSVAATDDESTGDAAFAGELPEPPPATAVPQEDSTAPAANTTTAIDPSSTSDYVWIPGHYRLVDSGYIWQAGAWVAPSVASRSYYFNDPFYNGWGPYYGYYGYYGYGPYSYYPWGWGTRYYRSPRTQRYPRPRVTTRRDYAVRHATPRVRRSTRVSRPPSGASTGGDFMRSSATGGAVHRTIRHSNRSGIRHRSAGRPSYRSSPRVYRSHPSRSSGSHHYRPSVRRRR